VSWYNGPALLIFFPLLGWLERHTCLFSLGMEKDRRWYLGFKDKGVTMDSPLIVVSKFRVKEGKLTDLKRYYRKILDIVEANKTQMIAFHGFLNEEGTEMTSIQIHPNPASMEYHMQVLKENWDESFSQYSQMVEGTTIEYYGIPPESALAMNEQSKQVLTIRPVHIAGFTHP
jgi:hypothetical protein